MMMTPDRSLSLRILRIHNHYQIHGGEDVVFEAECTLLERYGHEVYRLEFSNDEIPDRRSHIQAIKLAGNTIWSEVSRHQIDEAISEFQPDVIHFDNTFPLVSPAAYGIGKRRGVAVVQTLHNYRLLCPSGVLYHDDRIYEDNLGKLVPWRAVKDRVYRDSYPQTFVLAAMLVTHRTLGTWRRKVDRYIALNEFQRQTYIRNGFDEDKIVVKPNFASFSDASAALRSENSLYVGRLSTEKGISTLLSGFAFSGRPLHIAGDGPLLPLVEEATAVYPNITYLGRISGDEVRHEMSRARTVVLASECYENFPMIIAEAFATGTPVIVAKLGGIATLVKDGTTGLHFEAGNAEDLAAKVAWASEHPVEMQRMGTNARREYEAKYTPERNYEMLMDIYRQAIAHNAQRRK